MTTSVTRSFFTKQYRTCKTDFLVSDRSCPKTDGLRPHQWHHWYKTLLTLWLQLHVCGKKSCHHLPCNYTELFMYRYAPGPIVTQRCQIYRCAALLLLDKNQWCGLRPSVLGQDRSETKKIGLGRGLSLAVLVLFCETRSCNACRHNDLEGHSNFQSPIYSFSVLCLEHHYCGDQQWRSLT